MPYFLDSTQLILGYSSLFNGFAGYLYSLFIRLRILIFIQFIFEIKIFFFIVIMHTYLITYPVLIFSYVDWLIFIFFVIT
jgi:hypothetical protein